MENLDYKDLVAVTALLIHASKIDEHYSEEEKILINNFIKSLNTNNYDNIKIIDEAEQLEKDSNQLLTFTNIIKKKKRRI